MSLIKCEISLILTWSANSIISSVTAATKFETTYTRLYVPLVTLATQDNAKLIEQLKFSLKRIINWNKHRTKRSTEKQKQYLDYLIDPSFQRVNRPFVLSFENKDDREVHIGYFLLKVEIKEYNVMIDGKNFFDQPLVVY